jgi:Zn-finger nucleic acid-binding protein
MRILIKCPQCARRYDASRIKIGSRVRCHCGKVMRVHQPRSHDSAVVRCSSCGAPREGGSQQCIFCHSDFTLHERDLHTVCAECLTRVSDRAKFCHHCGARMMAEVVAGERLDWTCPECGDQQNLSSRPLGREQISVAECQKCAGLWIGAESFAELRDRVARDASRLKSLQIGPPRPAQQEKIQQRQPYRPCPRCKKLMNRRQYARGSGVVIDICRDHGLWFDAHELSTVLDWISRGGTADDAAERLAQEQQERIRRAEAELETRRHTVRRPRDPIEEIVEDVLESVLAPLARLFKLE